VQFAITRVAVLRRANGPDPEPPLGVHEHESSGDRREHPLMPHIARWVKPDVVVSAAGCRIDEHLEQWPPQASSEPVIPDRPEVAPRGYVDRYITLSDW